MNAETSMQMATGYQASSIVRAGVKLGVFAALAGEGAKAREVAEETGSSSCTEPPDCPPTGPFWEDVAQWTDDDHRFGERAGSMPNGGMHQSAAGPGRVLVLDKPVG